MLRYLVREHALLPKSMGHAINICTRNHYVIEDARMWLDHIELLQHFGLDTHNAHYVCPKDLQAAHRELIERRNRERAMREAAERAKNYARQLQTMDKERAAYVKMWGDMLTLSLSADNLTIQPLHSVDEFAEEGAKMHHCVFSNHYYNSRSSLILSAKDEQGNRLATIEYKVGSGQIAQCRAACNGVPARDKEIRALITSHRADFQRLLKAA